MVDDEPKPPDLTREMLTYDPVRYAALHPAPPDEWRPPSRHRGRNLLILALVAAIPAALFAMVSAGYRHVEVTSSASLIVFFVAWLLVLVVLAARSVLLRDR